jgi:hypothetical protein
VSLLRDEGFTSFEAYDANGKAFSVGASRLWIIAGK